MEEKSTEKKSKKLKVKNPLKSSLVKEFKDFINKGNVIDLAVAVIIGAAFSAIVTGLVNYIIMPLIGAAVGKGLDQLVWVVNESDMIAAHGNAYSTAALEDDAAVIVKYGAFIQTIIDFFIIAVIMFFVVKGYMSLKTTNKNKYYGFTFEEYSKLKNEGLKRKDIKALAAQNAEELAKKAKAAEEEKARNSVEGILKDIRTLLEKQVGTTASKLA